MMIKGIKGKHIVTTAPNTLGMALIFALFCIILALLVNFGHAEKFLEPGAGGRMAAILVAFLIWFALFIYIQMPSVIFFHENGFHCVGLEAEELDISREGRVPWRERFYFYDDVDYVFLQIDEEHDEGDVEERLRGKFIFRISGVKYNYRAWAVKVEQLDEILIERLGNRYMGTLVQKVD